MALQTVINYLDSPATGTAKTVYAIIHGADSVNGAASAYNINTTTWDTSINNTNWTQYKLAIPEATGGAGTYAVQLPVALRIPGRTYDIAIFEQAGGTAATTDTLLGTLTHYTGRDGLRMEMVGTPTSVGVGEKISCIVNIVDDEGSLLLGPSSPPTVAITSTTGAGSTASVTQISQGMYIIEYTATAQTAGDMIYLTATCSHTYSGTGYTVNLRQAAPVRITSTTGALSLTGGDIDQIADGVWGSSRSVDNVSATAWGAGTMGESVNLTQSGLAAATITSAKFAASAIDATAIASNAITSTKFASGAITSTVIATDAIGSAQLASTATVEIANQVETTLSSAHGGGAWGGGGSGYTLDQIADGVWSASRSTNSAAASWGAGTMGASVNVTSSGLADGSITVSKLADNAISSAKIATGAITAAKFAASAIDAAALATDAASEIATQTNTTLTAAHGSGAWTGGGGGGGTGIEITVG